MVEASQNGELIDHLGTLGKEVADLNARDVGGGGPECTAVFLRGIGLGIPCFMLAGSTSLPENDDGLVFKVGWLGGSSLKTQDVR